MANTATGCERSHLTLCIRQPTILQQKT